MDLLKNIKNKEILSEVLHLSVDYLIGNINDQQALRLSHKYGFQNPNDFLLATKSISQYYSICCLDRYGTESWIFGSRLKPELCRIVIAVLNARQPEVLKHMNYCEYSKINQIINSFFWDIRLVIGDCVFGGSMSQVLKLSLVVNQQNVDNPNIVFQMNKQSAEKVIAVLEHILAHTKR